MDIAKKEIAILAVYVLEKTISGEFDLEFSLSQLTDIDDKEDKFIASAWHALFHFSTDSDIRQRDTAYDAYLKNQLKISLEKIKNEHVL